MRLDSVITVPTEEMYREDWSRLFSKLTIVDNDGVELQAFDHRSGAGVVVMPRGARPLLPDYLDVSDLRSKPLMPSWDYVKELDAPGYAGQSAAVDAMFEHEQGQIIAPPGRGKTEMALAFIAKCETRVLVVVHTNDLFNQWVERAAESVPGLEVGEIRGQTYTIGQLTVATVQTLKKYIGQKGKFWRQFGAIIIDECHHAAAETWEWLLNSCPAFYRFGFTASEKRSDGRQQLVAFNIGPVIYKLAFESGVPMSVIPVVTKFRASYNANQYTKLVRQLVNDQPRNEIIAKIVLAEIKNGNSVLVLSRQIKHLELIHELIVGNDETLKAGAKVVTGALPRSNRHHLIQQLRDGDIRCILGTQLFEEGVDIPRLNRIVLAFPGTEITALQKVGRGSRRFVDKDDCLVYDLIDRKVSVLVQQWRRRKAWYISVGITLRKGIRYGTKSSSGTKRSIGSVLRVARSRRA